VESSLFLFVSEFPKHREWTRPLSLTGSFLFCYGSRCVGFLPEPHLRGHLFSNAFVAPFSISKETHGDSFLPGVFTYPPCFWEDRLTLETTPLLTDRCSFAPTPTGLPSLRSETIPGLPSLQVAPRTHSPPRRTLEDVRPHVHPVCLTCNGSRHRRTPSLSNPTYHTVTHSPSSRYPPLPETSTLLHHPKKTLSAIQAFFEKDRSSV